MQTLPWYLYIDGNSDHAISTMVLISDGNSDHAVTTMVLISDGNLDHVTHPVLCLN